MRASFGATKKIIMVNKMQNCCRTCLSHTASKESVYENGIIETIYEVFQVSIEKVDSLPSKICKKCIKQLNMGLKFRNSVILVQNTLQCLPIVDAPDSSEITSVVSINTKPSTINAEYNNINANIDQNTATNVCETVKNTCTEVQLKTQYQLKEPQLILQDIKYDKNLMQKSNCGVDNIAVNDEINTVNNAVHVKSTNKISTETNIVCTTEEENDTEKTHKNTKIEEEIDDDEYFGTLDDDNDSTVDLDVGEKEEKPKKPRKKYAKVQAECPICQRKLLRQRMCQHIRTHSNTEYQVKCPICGKVSKNKTSQKSHMYNHVKEHNICNVCGLQFEYKGKYMRHMQLHREKTRSQASQVCKVCGKTFPGTYQIRRHYRVHTKEKPYKCKSCDKAFTGSYGLRTHEKKHTNEKPYPCHLCPVFYYQKCSLKTHLENKHMMCVEEVKKVLETQLAAKKNSQTLNCP